MLGADASPDEWDDTVAIYCLAFGVQFGFQTFTSRKVPGGAAADAAFFPSTTFIATHGLTAALRDVASRTTTTAAPSTPQHLAGLAAAVRELHATIFAPYATWLRAARLRRPPGPGRQHLHGGSGSGSPPDADSLHIELADLALYWLIYAEAANLRHTPEMVWFIFFCAQRSWQAMQVVNHLKLHRDALAALAAQPWLAAHGPGLPRALKSLHAAYRRFLAGGAAAAPGGGPGGLMSEATLTLPYGSGTTAAAAATATASTTGGVGDAEAERASVRVTVLADGSVSMPYNPASAATPKMAKTRMMDTDMEVMDVDASDDVPPSGSGSGSGSGAGSSPSDDVRDTRGRRRMGTESPLLPLPPSSLAGGIGSSKVSASAVAHTAHSSVATSNATATAEKTFVGGNSLALAYPYPASASSATGPVPRHHSAFAATAAGAAASSEIQQHATGTTASHGHGHGHGHAFATASRLTPMASTPTAPTWDPRVAPADYRELLLRICPNQAAVAAALAASGCGGAAAPATPAAAAAGGPPAADPTKRGGAGGGFFLERVLQPLFLFLSEQVYELGQARRQGLESAVRIGYDDVSESMAHPKVVAAALAALPWANTIVSDARAAGFERVDRRTGTVGGGGGGGPNAATAMPRAAIHDEELFWSRLLKLGDLTPHAASARIPWMGDMAHYRPQLLKLITGVGASDPTSTTGAGAGAATGANDSSVRQRQRWEAQARRHQRRQARRAGGTDSAAASDSDAGGRSGAESDLEAPALTSEQASQAAAAAQAVSPEAAAELKSLRGANAAADWWARHVLRKTFVEHRSLAMPLLAFARVYQFQLLWFYLLAVWSWADPAERMAWIASAAALHWGSHCLLWSAQAVLSAGAAMKRSGTIIPFYSSKQGKPQRGSGPAAPTNAHGLLWWVVQVWLLGLCWGALGAALYIAYIVWPNHDLYGLQCYPLLWSRSCYWWIAVVYFGAVVLYELLYRQLNLGGYARAHIYDSLLRLVPGGGTASASSAASPMYDPATFLRTGLSYLLGNGALWAAALGLKFVIDWFVLVQPAGPRLADIMSTNLLAWSFYVPWGWWPEGWPRNFTVDMDPCMAAALVIVLFMLSMVSSSVSYSVACAVLGALQGVRQGLGAIRHWVHIRAGFHRVQLAMRTKLLVAAGAEPRMKESRSFAYRAARSFFTGLGSLLLLPFTAVVALLRWARCLPPPRDDKPKSWEQREETLSLTAPFWNAVVRSMRGRDLLSNREAEALSFVAVSLSPASMMATWRRNGSVGAATMRQSVGAAEGAAARGPRETYLPPVAVYVAQIPAMVITGSATAEQLEALQEAYLYLLHLLVAVGAIPRSAPPAAGAADPAADAAAAAAADAAAHLCPDLHKDNFHPDKFMHMPARAGSHKRLVARRELLGSVVALVRALGDAGKVYKDTATAAAQTQVTSGGGNKAGAAALAARGRAIEKLCMALHAVARCMTQMHDLPWSVGVIANRVVVRQHYHQPAVRAALDRGFAALVAVSRNNATAWGAQHLPTYEDFAKVASWLLAILRPSDEGTAPSNAEALALLADFCAGLLHPELPTPPRVEAMRSVSTLIPHYQETVMYALSSADARRVLERAAAAAATGASAGATAQRNAPGGGTGGATLPPLEGNLADDEVLFKNDDGAPSELLQYLVSEFPDEFRNLLERCKGLVPLGKGEAPYVLEDFLPFGRLYAQRAQLLLWASFRGQVLARTVDGMCMYGTALAMQAVQDAMTAPPPASSSKGGAAGGGGAAEGRLRLTGVQKLMVRGIMRDTSLGVEELVAQLQDVVPGLGPLLERKYGLVVSSQVYAKMAGSASLADRWRAHGIRMLATRYPLLRVAYLEADGEALTLFKAPDFTYRVTHQASVLVRAVPVQEELERRRAARAERAAAAAAAAAAEYGGSSHHAMMHGGGSLYGVGASSAAVPPVAGGSATATCVTLTSGSWLQQSPMAGGGGAAAAAAAVIASLETCSILDGTPRGGSSDGEDSDDDGAGGDGATSHGDDGAGAALRLWRRRYQLKHLDAAELEVLFRQQLPVNYYDTAAAGVGVILGEGKPENQNTAVAYCTGVVLQTIDMNQDNSLAQAFKLRNATREFEPLGPGKQQQQVAIVGYPEWIFSYRCGLLADLAAATERTFGTQIQRVMAYPSAVRCHYGHPDLWNKLFSMTRGGISKANAAQHVSEDVFGGYNALKRGGLSKYVSYISVGKGRDMGLDSILGFEAKISKGCAEQLMSRDVRFLGCHTDFFRSLSLYATGPGHFINTWLTVQTIQLGVWVQLLLLLGGVASQGGSLAAALGAVQILQLGTLPLLGYLFNLWLEAGLATALATLFRQFIAGGLLFHIFRSATSAFHLGRATLFGGAAYIATGRGFSLRRKTFTQVYVNYGRSHMYLGMDVLIMVILILVVGNNGGSSVPIPAAAMWSPLLVAAALLAGPFWFTPFFFRLSQVMRDTREFRSWVAGSAARGVPEGWAEWNANQLSALRNDAGVQVPRYRFWSNLAIVLPRAAITSLSAIAAVTGAHFNAPPVPDLLWVLGGSVFFWALLWLWATTRRSYTASGLAQRWRWAKGLVQLTAVAALCFLAAICIFMPQRGLRFSGVLITLYANYQVAQLLVAVAVSWFPKTMAARRLANAAFRQADVALGTALAAVLVVICFIGEIGLVMVDKVQTLVQFNDRYSHAQAARPYAGDDDPAAAAVRGDGGGGGLVAAAAAALRRRIPSHQALPLLSGGGGAPPSRGGGGGGGGAPVAGASGVPMGSTPGGSGWVSPAFGAGGRGGTHGGSSTPVQPVVYGSTNVGGILAAVQRSPSSAALLSAAGAGSSAYPAAPLPVPPVPPMPAAVSALRVPGTADSSGAATPTFSAPMPPAAHAAYQAQLQQQLPASRMGPSRQTSINTPGGGGGPSSKDLSWGSSGALPRPIELSRAPTSSTVVGGAPSRTASGVSAAAAAAAGSSSSAVPPLAAEHHRYPSNATASLASANSANSAVNIGGVVPGAAAAATNNSLASPSASVVVAAHSRLPPAEDWQAVANAAAEAALARGAMFNPTATFSQYANGSGNGNGNGNGNGGGHVRSSLRSSTGSQGAATPPLAAAMVSAPGPAGLTELALPQPAWGSRPTSGVASTRAAAASAAGPNAAVPRISASGASSNSILDNMLTAADGSESATSRVSPMRARQAPRAVLPAIAPPPAQSAAVVAGAAPPAGLPAIRVSPRRRVSGSGSGSGSNSFAAPPAVADGPLSGWVQPRSMPYDGNSTGGSVSSNAR